MRIALGLFFGAGAASEETVWFLVRIWSGEIARCSVRPSSSSSSSCIRCLCAPWAAETYLTVYRGAMWSSAHNLSKLIDQSSSKKVGCSATWWKKGRFSCSTRGLLLLPGSLFPVAFSFFNSSVSVNLLYDFRNCSSIGSYYNLTTSQISFKSTFPVCWFLINTVIHQYVMLGCYIRANMVCWGVGEDKDFNWV